MARVLRPTKCGHCRNFNFSVSVATSIIFLTFFVTFNRALKTNEQEFPDAYVSLSEDLQRLGTCGYETCETDEIVVEFHENLQSSDIEKLAEKHGYTYAGPVGDVNFHVFKRLDRNRVKRHAFQSIFDEPLVKWAEPQFPKVRVKRDFAQNGLVSPVVSKPLWLDPLYTKQWYLRAGAIGGYDMRVREAWKLGYSGKGVVVSILDDGIQGTHPDLAANYDPLASTDINGNDNDPTPRNNGDNKHGTRCAGEVASVAGNAWCGVGIAYNAKIGGVRMLDGPVSDRVEGNALMFRQDHIDIYSASWGPDDDGQTFDGPGSMAKLAFFKGANDGRRGKGNIFIWASGNGGSYQDSCSCDGYTTSIYTLSVSSATFDNRQPWYLEECPSTLCTTYSSANRGQPAIISTDMPDTCTEQHTGTSASAPIAAGIVALALEANNNLTWRDMQHLVVRTSVPTPLLANPGWSQNAVGRMVSNKFGYGLMNAEALVKLAKRWVTVPPHKICSYVYRNLEPEPLRGKFVKNYTLYASGRCLHTSVLYLEHVQAVISIQFKRRGDLYIVLTSPRGTRSVLLPPRPRDDFRTGFQKWPFLSVQQWGENPEGHWTLTVANVGSDANTGNFHDWSLTLYGTDQPPLIDQPSNWMNLHRGQNRTTPELPPIEIDEGFGTDGSSRQHEVEFPRHAQQSGSGGPWAGAPVDPKRGGSADPGMWSARDPAAIAAPVAGFSSSAASFFGVGGRDAKIIRENCHKECNSDGCYVENSAQDCVTCRNFQQFLRNRGGIKCVDHCDAGYFADETSKRCNQCWSGCATCSRAQFCDTCPQGTSLVDIDPEHFHHGKCASRCPEGYVNVTEIGNTTKCVAICGRDCLTCENGQKCRYCKENFFMSPARQCLALCPELFFANKETRKCEECIPNCLQCNNKNDCVRCASEFAFNSSSAKCDLETAQKCQVTKDCPSGQYCEPSDKMCQVCHMDCVNCIGPAFDHCTSCRNGQPTDSRTRQCLPCHSGQYYKAETGDCLPCDKTCAVCLGSSRTQCVKCSKGHKQYGSICEPCCEKSVSPVHGKYCVPCDDLTESSNEKSSTAGNFSKIILIFLIVGSVFSIALFVVLMCRHQNYAQGTKKYAYSKLPTDVLNMDSENKLLINPQKFATVKNGTDKNPLKFVNLETANDLLAGDSENSDEDEDYSTQKYAFDESGPMRENLAQKTGQSKDDNSQSFPEA